MNCESMARLWIRVHLVIGIRVLFLTALMEIPLEIGEIAMYPRALEISEKQKLEAYLAYKWDLQDSLPEDHLYAEHKPVGNPSLILNGIPAEAGVFPVNLKVSNEWGEIFHDFNLTVNAIPPRIRTTPALDIGSTSVRLSSNLIETGGESVEVSYLWGTDPSALSNETNSTTVSSIGSTFTFLSLSPNTTYYYQAKALNSAGQSNGLDLSTLPYFNWELNDSGSVAVDSSFRADGQIFGATSEWDAELGSSVLEFDGDDDYVDLGDIMKWIRLIALPFLYGLSVAVHLQ